MIFSYSRHDFRYCKCGKTFVDGGLDYLRYGWDGEKPEEVVREDDPTTQGDY